MARSRQGGGTPLDLQGLIDRELEAGRKRIAVPPGRYRVTPRNGEHLRLEGLRDVEIVADGVEMVCTETTRAVTLQSCRNVTVRGLTIDYDPLPFTQGRIVAMADDKRWLDLELFAGYPTEGVRAWKFEIFDPATRTLRTDTYHGIEAERIAPTRYRVTKTGHYRYDAAWHLEQVGDIAVIAVEHAPGGSVPHAVYADRCEGLTLDGVAVYASNCFGFLETGCTASRYVRCRVDRPPLEDDLKERDSPRIRSLNADAFHSKHAPRGPVIERCVARFQGDDCVAINGDYHMVMATRGRTLRVLAKHGMNIEAGDPVELVAYDGRRLPDARAVAIAPDGSIRDDERAFLARQRMNDSLKAARGALTRAYAITLDREVELPRGSVVCSANRIGNGFAVRDCTFGFNRSRGLVIKASSGEIRGNTFKGCWHETILVAPEWWWLEAGSSNDVAIAGNTIRDGRGVAIAVYAFGGSGAVAPPGAHNRIAVTSNTIKDCPLPGILVTSTAGLTLDGNALGLSSDRRIAPWAIGRFRIKELGPVVQIHTRE